MSQGVGRALMLLALLVGLAACASANVTTTEYVGVPHFPPGEPAKVEILRSERPSSSRCSNGS